MISLEEQAKITQKQIMEHDWCANPDCHICTARWRQEREAIPNPIPLNKLPSETPKE